MFAITLALSGALASNNLPTIFGQQLGSSISYPECPYDVGFDKSHVYSGAVDVPCFQELIAEEPTIKFPINQIPHLLSIDELFLKTMHGTVEQISAGTVSMHYSDIIISNLSAKFGAPTARGTETFTPHGIAITGIYVMWRRSGYRVRYDSIDNGDLEHGSLEVSTDKFLAAEKIQNDKVEAARVGL